jgi:hypothetical protein
MRGSIGKHREFIDCIGMLSLLRLGVNLILHTLKHLSSLLNGCTDLPTESLRVIARQAWVSPAG